jgi:hypothetical protein
MEDNNFFKYKAIAAIIDGDWETAIKRIKQAQLLEDAVVVYNLYTPPRNV